MPRVLFVSTSTTIGGAEKTLHVLAAGLNSAQFPPSGLISLKPPGFHAEALKSLGHRVESLNAGRAPTPADLLTLGRLIKEFKPDIVHAFMYQAIQLCRAVRILGLAQFKLVSSPRVHYRTRSGASLLVDRLLKAADDLLIAESESSRSFLIESQGYATNKVSVIRNGLLPDPSEAAIGNRTALRRELGIAEDELLVGTVGRLDLQKGHAVLLEAAALRPQLRLVLLGGGPEQKALERRAAELNLLKRVFFIGERRNARFWMSAFDIFVLPSLWEGIPNALMEAMSLGLPCAASRVDGIPEILSHEDTGLLFEPGSPEAAAAALARLANDSTLRLRLGARAKRFAEERFKTERMIGDYEKAYRSLLPEGL